MGTSSRYLRRRARNNESSGVTVSTSLETSHGYNNLIARKHHNTGLKLPDFPGKGS